MSPPSSVDLPTRGGVPAPATSKSMSKPKPKPKPKLKPKLKPNPTTKSTSTSTPAPAPASAPIPTTPPPPSHRIINTTTTTNPTSSSLTPSSTAPSAEKLAPINPYLEQLAPYALYTKQEPPTAVATAVANATVTDELPPLRRAHHFYKIALFAWESLHSVAVGGVAPHVTELGAALERRGHEVHVFVRTAEGQPSYERIHGVHVHRVSFDLSPDFVQEVRNMCNAMVHFMLETEAFMDTHFDICHAHDWLAAPALANIKINHQRTCVFTVHSTEFGRCGNNVYGGQSAVIRDIEADAIAKADKVIGVSGILCDEIKAHYSFDWDKLRCVYNGVNCLRYDGNLWDAAEVRMRYGVAPMDPMVLFVGRMATQKGPDILVDAIPAVLAARADSKFVLVGDGYMKEGLVARVHSMGVASSVCFTGSMTGQALVDLFKACDVVAIPSRNEPFGIVTLEAWASNKPVVVTKSGGPREFVWHDHDGYLVDTTAEGMAWGICNAFSNFEHARYMGERGRVKAAFQFSWDNIAENTNNIYDELVSHGVDEGEMEAASSDAVHPVEKLRVVEEREVI